jgi:predicted nuclease of predicted toxin-antitoxin system
MRFLTDENVMKRIVDELRGLGFDVTTVAEHMLGAADPEILRSDAIAGRIFITEDQDFGDLVVRQRMPVDGVVLLELRRMSPENVALRAVGVISKAGSKLQGHFTVIEPTRVRSRPL